MSEETKEKIPRSYEEMGPSELSEYIDMLVWYRRSRDMRLGSVPAIYDGENLLAENDSWLSMHYGTSKSNLRSYLVNLLFHTLGKGYFEIDSFVNALFSMCRDNFILGINFSLKQYGESEMKEYAINFDSIEDMEIMKSLDFVGAIYDNVSIIEAKF